MDYYCLEPQDPRWSETLNYLRHDVYHLPEYVALEAQRTKTHGAAFLAVEADHIFFVPYLLRECSDLHHTLHLDAEPIFDIISPYGYPGLIVSESAQGNLKFLKAASLLFVEALSQQKVCSAFIRLHPILGEHLAELFSPEMLLNNGTTISVDLTLSESEIWAHTRKGHQSSINKCKRLGYETNIVPITENLNDFLDIYRETMERVYAQDFYFFDKDYFLSLLQLKQHVHLCMTRQNNQAVSATLLFECCGIVQAHLGGTKTAFLKDSPFMAVLNYARYWAKERGNEFFHLGGGVGGSTQDSLYRFKKGFSRQSYPFFTLRLVVNPALYETLVNLRAAELQVSTELLKQSDFFPAYRTPS